MDSSFTLTDQERLCLTSKPEEPRPHDFLHLHTLPLGNPSSPEGFLYTMGCRHCPFLHTRKLFLSRSSITVPKTDIAADAPKLNHDFSRLPRQN